MAILHPQVAYRSCVDCEKYIFDETTGEMKLFGGKPVARVKGTHAPCRYDDRTKPEGRCPKGTPENSRALTPRNKQAWDHYLECKAVGEFPKDAIVRRNAGIIRQIEDRMADATRRLLELLLKVK